MSITGESMKISVGNGCWRMMSFCWLRVFSGNWHYECRVMSDLEKNKVCSKWALQRTCEVPKGPWKLMGVEQNGLWLGLRAQRGVSELNNFWWFPEKFGYQTWQGPLLKIAFLVNWSEILGLKVKKQIWDRYRQKTQTKPTKQKKPKTKPQTFSSEL